MKYGLKFINKRKHFKECLSLKLNNKKEKKIFSKQFVTTEPTKYGLKFSVLPIIINEKNFVRNVFRWSETTKKESKIFSKQFVTTEPTKYGLKFSVLLIMIIKQKKTF